MFIRNDRMSKFSMVATEALLNLGVKLDDMPNKSSTSTNVNVDWLNTVIKAKSQVISREFKDAIKSIKSLDTNVINFPRHYFIF